MKAAAWLASAFVAVTFVPMLAIAAVVAAAVPPITPCTAPTPVTGAVDPTTTPTDGPCPTGDAISMPPIDEPAVWADGSDCGFEGVENPHSCQQALNEAARIANSHPCDNEVRGGTWLHRCLEFVGRVYGYRAAGTPTALQHYNLLKARGAAWTEIRIDLDPAERQRMVELTGRTTVPQIFIGERHVGGFDDLAALDRAGGLKPLLEGVA